MKICQLLLLHAKGWLFPLFDKKIASKTTFCPAKKGARSASLEKFGTAWRKKIPIFQQMREGFSLSSAPFIRLSVPSAPALLASTGILFPKFAFKK